jgi:TRAP-type transport system periplasmic protein
LNTPTNATRVAPTSTAALPWLVSTAVALAASSALAQSPAPLTLKVGYANTKESHLGVGATVFCEELQAHTAGRYVCQHFPSNALGGEREMTEGLQIGTIDVANLTTGPLGNFVPDVRVLDLPFLFRDYDHARKTLDGTIGQELLAKFAPRGLVALAWTENGFRHMTNSRRAITKPADAAGLKLRTMENKVHMEGFRAVGVQPTPMAFPELFGALQQGTVDGQENPIPVIMASKFSQVQKHLSLTGHVYSPAVLMVSPRLWGKVAEADKPAFVDAARKAAAAQRKKVNDDEATGVALLEQAGMAVVRNVDGQAFRDAMKPVYANLGKELGAEQIKRIQDVR